MNTFQVNIGGWILIITWSLFFCYIGYQLHGFFDRFNKRDRSAAPDLIDVAHMVLTTATVYTPPELVKAATEALRKAGEI